MRKVTIAVPEFLAVFYEQIGQQAGGIPVEKVMADALFKLAGELSLDAIGKKTRMAE